MISITISLNTQEAAMKFAIATLFLLPALLLASLPAAADSEVNVYSARHYDVDQIIYDAFTEQTGIEVRVLEGSSDQLVERIQREGAASPADVLITVDAGRLWRAEEADVFQPAESERLEQRIPANLRHPDGLWFGFSRRLRVIFYSKDRFDPERIERYEDLADPSLQGAICIRSSNNIYNQSLLASMIEAHGAQATEEWARGLVDNLARPPQGGDTDQLRGVAAGECDVAVANDYYYHRLRNSDDADDRRVAEQLGVIYPNQEGRGTHVNVGGAGVVAGAPNYDNAIKLLEFLASEETQQLFAGGNFEYPVVASVERHESLPDLAEIKLDPVSVSALGSSNPEAIRVADRAGWR
jgi:iron(III) transport system substrate-binding protein